MKLQTPCSFSHLVRSPKEDLFLTSKIPNYTTFTSLPIAKILGIGNCWKKEAPGTKEDSFEFIQLGVRGKLEDGPELWIITACRALLLRKLSAPSTTREDGVETEEADKTRGGKVRADLGSRSWRSPHEEEEGPEVLYQFCEKKS